MAFPIRKNYQEVLAEDDPVSDHSAVAAEEIMKPLVKKLCLIVKLPYCQYRNYYKISQGTVSYRRACLISGCALAVLH